MSFQIGSIKTSRAQKKPIDPTKVVTTLNKSNISDNQPIVTPNTTDFTPPPKPTKHEYSTLAPRSKRKRKATYAERTRDFIQEMLAADGLGDNTEVEVLNCCLFEGIWLALVFFILF